MGSNPSYYTCGFEYLCLGALVCLSTCVFTLTASLYPGVKMVPARVESDIDNEVDSDVVLY